MLALNLLWICILCLNQFLSTQSKLSTFEHAINILELQNNRKFDILTIVADLTQNDNRVDHFLQTVFDLSFEGTLYYLVSILRPQNVVGMIKEIEKSSKSSETSLIVILDFRTSDLIRQMIYNLSSEQLQENTWLIINPYTYENTAEENIFISSLRHFCGTRIAFDTQLYVLSGTIYFASLTEIYKTCNVSDLSYKVMQTLHHGIGQNPRSISMWERRNNLMGCNLRVAYVDQPPYMTREKDTPINLIH